MRALVILAACSLGFSVVRGDSADLLRVAQRRDLHFAIAWSSANVASVTVRNSSSSGIKIEQPAGALFVAEGVRLVTLQPFTLEVAEGGSGKADVAVAALSSRLQAVPKAFAFSREREPRLEPLLTWLAQRTDVSSSAAQLAVLCVTENIGFAQWQQFLGSQGTARGEVISPAAPADIVAAIDALGVLREVAPQAVCALSTDGELKLRALRNPWCRAKAVELYGMTAPGAPALPPELSTLLHRGQGDNCPTCRQRGLQPDNGF